MNAVSARFVSNEFEVGQENAPESFVAVLAFGIGNTGSNDNGGLASFVGIDDGGRRSNSFDGEIAFPNDQRLGDGVIAGGQLDNAPIFRDGIEGCLN